MNQIKKIGSPTTCCEIVKPKKISSNLYSYTLFKQLNTLTS